MFKNPLFRERAMIRRAQPEPLDDLLRVTAPREWLLLAGIAVALLAALAWSVFAGVERTVTHGGTLVRPGERHTLVAAASGIVTEVAAEVGDRIEAGDSDSAAATSGTGLAAALGAGAGSNARGG